MTPITLDYDCFFLSGWLSPQAPLGQGTMAISFSVSPVSCTVPGTSKPFKYQLNEWCSQIPYVPNWTLNNTLISQPCSTPISTYHPLHLPHTPIHIVLAKFWHHLSLLFSHSIHPSLCLQWEARSVLRTSNTSSGRQSMERIWALESKRSGLISLLPLNCKVILNNYIQSQSFRFLILNGFNS